MAVAFVLQVVENVGVLGGAGHAQSIEGLEGHDPRGDGGAEVLSEEGAKGDVFPLLDVARGPVVEEHEPEDVIFRFGRRDALAERLAVEGDKGHFEFEVQQAGRAEDGRLVVGGARLAHRTANRRPTHHDARSPAVVPHRHVLPVGKKRVVRVAEHLANVAGVVLAGIKVRVVPHLHRQVHRHVRNGHEARRMKLRTVAKGRVV